MAGKRKFSQRAMINALLKARGVKAAAARHLGCDRATVDRYIAEFDAVGAAYITARETLLDDAEDVLFDKALVDKDTTSLIFLLRTVGRSRGYGDRVELAGSDGAPIVFEVVIDEASD